MTQIQWGPILLVAAVSIIVAVVLSALYAGGVRLLSVGRDDGGVHPAARAGAIVCFAIGIAAVLFGLWLVVPQFH